MAKIPDISYIVDETTKMEHNTDSITIDEINENGEKFFKLVELITDDKKFPQKKVNRIVGAIRVKEREKVS